MDNDVMASELHTAITCKNSNKGSVKKIAKTLGLEDRSVYDYLYGKIKISLDFLLAAVTATDGDPDIRKFLEPEGWRLQPERNCKAPTDNIEKEMLDVLVAISDLAEFARKAVLEKNLTPEVMTEIHKKAGNVMRQLSEVMNLIRDKREESRLRPVAVNG